MMHNSRSVSLRLLSLATRKTSLRPQASQLRSLQSSSEAQHNERQQSNRSLLTEEDAAKNLPKHAPDYTAMADYRTSTFSPVPTHVMDGSEPGDTLPAAVVSGAPTELQARTVRIYRPTKPATQSGTWHGPHWLMDWDPLAKGHRWENPLMGWQSSADFMQGERLGFDSKEDAIRFAEKQGYQYFVQEPNERKIAVKAYANNFSHSAKTLKIIRTK